MGVSLNLSAVGTVSFKNSPARSLKFESEAYVEIGYLYLKHE